MEAVQANNETARLTALYGYDILDSPSEEIFDNLTRLAALICEMPVAAINFVDANRQWIKSSVGLELREISRDVGFCSLCIQQQDILIITDTLADEQLANNPIVTSYPYVRFYAGVPLVMPGGYAIGTLCVVDSSPRQLTTHQLEALRLLSHQVVCQLEARRQLQERRDAIAQQEKLLRTEQQIVETALWENQHLIQQIAEATPVILYLHDALEQRNIYTNHQITATLGYSPQEIQQMGTSILSTLVHPEDWPRVTENLKQLMMAKDGEILELEYRIQRANGEWCWLCSRDTIFSRTADGTPYQILGTAQDITARKQAEQQIREQAALLDITIDAILVRDLDNQILFWNKGAELLYGWKREETLGKNANEILSQVTLPEWEVAQKATFERGEWQGELHQVTKAGTKVIVQSHWTLMRDEAGQPKSILTVNTNITEKKQLEAQFLRAQRMESIGTLAGGIAHDLNNILAPILMAIQLLEKKLIDAHSQRLLNTLETNAKRGADLVKQVLSFARGIEANRAIVQVRHLISEIKQIAKETFPKSIEFNTEIPRDLWTIYGDATQLHQVLMNFCLNARDAMPDGGTLSIRAENVFLDQNYAGMNLDAHVGPYIAIAVSDTGTGIPPEILDKIFEPFFTTKEMGQGTGLGLSTVMSIIKNHGGFVQVYSEVGKGTQFQVYLPALETTETQQFQEEIRELPAGEGELILVVDDEAAIREISKESLEAYAYKVITASDGIEAIALYMQYKHAIRIVLVDMMMPLMDGATTIRTLQKINSQVPLVAVSGLASNHQFAKLEGLGIRAFLSKPYTAKELLQTMNEVLRGNSY